MRMKMVTESQTLKDAAKEFLAYKKAQKIRERTLKDYHKYIDPFIVQSSNSMDIDVLRRETLEYFADIPTTSPARYNHPYQYLHALFAWCAKQDYLPYNPFEKLELKKNRDEGKVQPAEIKDIQALLKILDKHNYTELRDYNIILLMLDTGIRTSELMAIKNPYFMTILSSAEEQLRSKGYSISFIRTGKELIDRNLLVSTFEGDVTGLLLMDTLDQEIYDYIRSRVPYFVGVDTRMEDIDNVAYNHHQVAICGTEHLISLGHTKIGYIGGSSESETILESFRYQGFTIAMQSAGLPVNPDWVINCEWDEELCAEKTHELCQSGDLPTAFFVGSDLMAIATMNALADHHISVPAQISIVGMFDIEIARFTTPALTTLQVPKEQLGIIAANLLIDRINGSTLLPQKVTLPSRLIVRNSTK